MNFRWGGLGGRAKPPPPKCRGVGGLGGGRAQPSLPPDIRGGVGGRSPPHGLLQKGCISDMSKSSKSPKNEFRVDAVGYTFP